MRKRIVFALISAGAFGVLALGCSNSDGDIAEPGIEPLADEVGGGIPVIRIAAHDDRFDKEELTAPANSPVLIEFDNRDQGVLHNVSFYRAPDATGRIFVGQLFPGSETREYTFETPDPGSYFFRCDVHPDEMTGTLTVS